MKKILSLLAFFSLTVFADTPANWLAATKPFHIAGPIYYVGTQGLGVYLIKTSAGFILLSGAMPPSTMLVRDAVRALAFKPEEIRLLLVSHAHADHVGTLADLKKITGGSVVAMGIEAPLLESGGKADYLFGDRVAFRFSPVKPDRLIKDGEVVTLGDVSLTAHLTPGHTRGCTTWEMTFQEDKRKYDVVFLDGTTVNEGTRLGKNPSYPGIADDYKKTFTILEGLHPDIFLAYHAEAFDFEKKRERSVKEGTKVWIDPEGYRSRVAQNKAKFEKLLVPRD